MPSARDVYKQQAIVRGFANHHRINILRLLRAEPKLSVDDIALRLKANYKTISVHVRRLAQAGLVSKKYKGNHIEHQLTKRGIYVLKFLGKLE